MYGGINKMTIKSKNRNLTKARSAKKDEFYTQLVDIEKELKHYKDHFKGKVVYCNCDDPRESNFFHYFSYNFEVLGLKKLITTCFKEGSGEAVHLEYEGDKNGNKIPDTEEIGVTFLKGDGDFRSEESIELLKQADIVVTNPPFSLFREYVTQLVEYDKKFIIVGSLNAITYKETFKLIKDKKLWLGHNNGGMTFRVPSTPETGYLEDADGHVWQSLGNICWYTNLPIAKRNEELILYKEYTPEEYLTYDNYDAINVDKVKDIPMDYDGAMGVPITFLQKHNAEQFEIIGLANDKREVDGAFVQGNEVHLDNQHKRFVGMVLKKENKLRATYARIIIKRK